MFDQFRTSSGLVIDDAPKQTSTFLHCLGEEPESVLSSVGVTVGERKDYDTVIAKLNSFFKGHLNVIFERVSFNRRNQLDGEMTEQFIIQLYRLADSCEYGDLKDEMISDDRLVVDIRDDALSHQLQFDPELTLDKANKPIRQQEAVDEQQRELKGAVGGTSNLEELRS